jgi:uncharacterized membrane protein
LKWLDKIISIVLVGSILFVVGSIYYVSTTARTGEEFTEFYILVPGGKAEGYPREMVRGEEKEVVIGIVNHEYKSVTYRVEVRVGGYLKNYKRSLSIEHDKKWEGPISFSALEPHENLKVEFLLFKEEDSEPYRSLHLWVYVRQNPPPC